MVTIEQKLSLFSKLLHRTMTEKFSEEMDTLKKEYDVKIRSNSEAVDREAEEIINRSVKKAEAEKVELLSRARIKAKREAMAVKDKYFGILMSNLRTEIDKFLLSDRYEPYLMGLAAELAGETQLSDSLVIYMKADDLARYGNSIKQILVKSRNWDISFKEADDSIIGGFIAEDTKGHIRVNLSVDALLEDNRNYIMQVLFQAIEAGDANAI